MFHISMGGVFQMGGGGRGKLHFYVEEAPHGRASVLVGEGGAFKKNRKMGGCPLCPSPNTGNPALSSNM